MESTTVLLVDDSDSSLFALGHALRDLGLQLRFAKGAEAGMQALEQERVDVVVSDHVMPGVDGIHFLADVAERYPGTARILMTTGSGIEVAIEAINRARVQHVLKKPVDQGALRAIVELVAARRLRDHGEQRVLAVLQKHPDLRALVEAAGDLDQDPTRADEPLRARPRA